MQNTKNGNVIRKTHLFIRKTVQQNFVFNTGITGSSGFVAAYFLCLNYTLLHNTSSAPDRKKTTKNYGKRLGERERERDD